ncbi:MAG: DUF362 domain-containing protein, partial [Candidatus Hodarchaeota archaeon]
MNEQTGKTKVIKIKSSGNLVKEIQASIDELGGIESFFQSGDVVTLKPNLNSADPYPASSDPEFIRALGEVILTAGISKLKFVESSMFRLKTRSVAEETGLLAVAED